MVKALIVGGGFLEDADAGYRWPVESGIDPGRTVLTGDSAGGGLAVVLATRLRDCGEQPPAAIVAMSPFADLSLCSPSIRARAGTDPIAAPEALSLMATNYRQGSDPRDPCVSPVYADLTGLPPTLVQVADNEALFDDAQRLVATLNRSDVDVSFETDDHSFHVFQNIAALPETGEALASVGNFVAAQVNSNVTHNKNHKTTSS